MARFATNPHWQTVTEDLQVLKAELRVDEINYPYDIKGPKIFGFDIRFVVAFLAGRKGVFDFRPWLELCSTLPLGER